MGSGSCVLLAVLAGAIAGPVTVNEVGSRCATKCSDSAKFQYTPGNVYEYTYEGAAITKLEGSAGVAPTVQLKAAVVIDVQTKCEFSLKLNNVTFGDDSLTPTALRDLRGRLERHFLRFSFQDGVVDALCPAPAEDDEVLNIKRGILSTLQTGVASFDSSSVAVEETDVAGVCPTSYEVSRSLLGTVTVKRSKELIGCTSRSGNVTALSGQPYTIPSAVQSLPLAKGVQRCEQTISRGIHTSATCSETHTLRPFSRTDGGASTEITTTLRFKAQRSRSTTRSPGSISRRTNLLFKHAYGLRQDPATAKRSTLSILSELCQQVKDDMRPETPELFARLVQAARGLSADDMRDILSNAQSGQLCATSRVSKFFLDAIPLIGSEASVAFMREMILTEKVVGLDADAWLLQLAFIQQPTADMLTSLQPLLESDSTRTKSLLGVSSLVHKVCSSLTNCRQLPPVAAAVRAIETALGSDCSFGSASERENIIVALKAFGNAGSGTASGAVLDRCSSNSNLDAEVRVAALGAFRRLPCTVQRDTAMRIFQNAAEDSEVRIAAYLASMTCPDSDILQKVKMVLSGLDSVNQVTSFVWTHLTNLQETSSVFRRDVQSIIQDAKLKSDYDADVLKYSRNYEKSFVSEYFNVGGQVESNIIFSDKSYVPRSAMLNLTVDLFGTSVNLLEVGGRVQGIESVLQKLFGKDGYFSVDYLKKFLNSKADSPDGISKIIEKLLKINNDDVQGSVYLRTFGNEILYGSTGSLSGSRPTMASLLARLAEQKDHDLTHSSVLVDSTVVLPTAAGWPLNVSVQAVATVNLQIGGKADLQNVDAAPRSMELSGYVKPSGAVRVLGSMGINSLSSQSMIQVVSTLHSSTALEGKAKLQDGQIFSVEVKAPKDKTEVLSVETKFLMNGREVASQPEGRTETRRCTSQLAGQITGLELCAELSLPEKVQAGTSRSAIVLNRVDTMSAYVFEASRTATEEGKRQWRIMFDTPGSSTNRKLLADLSVDAPRMTVEANVISPWKTIQTEAAIVDQLDKKQMQVRAVIDGQQVYSALAEVGIDEKKTRTAYTPRLEIQIAGRAPIAVTATLETSTRRPALFELTVSNVFSSQVKVNGAVNKDKSGESYTSDVAIASPWLNAKADGAWEYKKDTQGFRVNLVYPDASQAEQRFSLAGKVSDRSKGALSSYKGSLSLSTTQVPWLALSIEGEMQHAPDRIESQLRLMHGEDRKTLVVKHSTNKRLLAADLSTADLAARTTVEYAPRDVSIVIDAKHKHNATDAACSFEVQYAPAKTVKFTWAHANRFEADGLLTAALTADLPQRSVAFSSELTQPAANEYMHKLHAQWARGSSAELSNTVRLLSDTSYELSGILKVPDMPVSYSGNLRLDPKDCGIKVEVMHMKDIYSLESKGSWQSPAAANGEVRVVVPQRTVAAKGGWTFGDGSLSLNADAKWDVDRDDSKQVLLTTEYKLAVTSAQTTFDASVVAASPLGRLNVITGTKGSETSATATFALQLNDKKTDMSAQFDLPSSGGDGRAEFSSRLLLMSDHIQAALGGSGRYEALLTHQLSEQVLSQRLVASWSESRQILASLRADTSAGLSLSAEVTTPFTEAAKFGVGAVVGGDFANMELDASSVAYWGDKNVTMTAKATRERGHLTMLFPRGTVTTTFSHSFDGSKLRNDVTVSWVSKVGRAREGTVRIVTNVGITQNGAVGTVAVTTPFQPRQLVISFDHQGDAQAQFTTQASLAWDDKKVSAALQNADGHGKITVVTPWRTAGASYQHAYSEEGAELSTSGELFWSAKEKISFDLSASGWKQQPLRAKLRVVSPFTGGLQDVEIRVNHRGTMANDFETSADLMWSPGQRLSTAVSLSRVADRLQGSVSLNTPFAQLPSVAIAVDHVGSSWALVRTTASLTIASNSPIAFTASVTNQDASGFTAAASVTGIPSVRLSSVQLTTSKVASASRKTTYSVTTRWNDNKELSARADVTELSSGIDAALQVVTPFERVAQLTGKVTHTGDRSRFSTQTEVAWSPREKLSVAVDYAAASRTYRLDARSPYGSIQAAHSGSWTAFTTSTKYTPAVYPGASAPIPTEASVEFSSLAGVVAGKAALSSPHEVARNIAVSFKHSGTSNDFTSSADATWAPGQSAAVSASLSTLMGVRAEVKASWPRDGSVAAKLVHTGNALSFKNRLQLSYGTQHSASLDTHFSRVAGVSGSIAFASTIARLRNFDVSVQHTGSSALQFENSVSASWAPGDSASFSSKLSALSGVRGEVTLQLPRIGKNSVSFQHDGVATAFSNRIDVAWGSGRLGAASQLSAIGSAVDGRLSFTSTFAQLEQLGVNFSHKGPWSSFENRAELSWASDRKASVATRFSMIGDNVAAGIDFVSPRQSVNAAVSHRGTDWRDFACKALLAWSQQQRIALSAEFNSLVPGAVKGKLSLSSPFPSYEDWRAEMQHAGDQQAFTNRMLIAWATDKQMTLDTNFAHVSGNTYRGGLLFVSPVRRIEGRLDHTGDTTAGFACSAELEYMTGKKIVGSATYSGTSNVQLQRVTASVSTPFASLSSAAATAELSSSNADRSSMESTINLKWNDQKPLLIVSRYRNAGHNWQSFELRQTVETPFGSAYERLSWSASGTVSSDKVDGRLEASQNGDTYQLDTNVRRDTKRGRIEASVTVRTPLADYRENRISFNLAQTARTLTFSAKGYIGSETTVTVLDITRKSSPANANTSESVTVKLTSPRLAAAQHLSVSYSLTSSGSYNGELVASIVPGTVALTLDGSHKRDANGSIQHSGGLGVSVDLPSVGMANSKRQYRYSFVHSHAAGTCSASLSKVDETTPERNAEVAVSGTWSTGKYGVELSAKTPYERLRDCSASATVAYTESGFEALAETKSMQQNVASLRTSANWQGAVQASFALTTPLAAARSLSASFELQNAQQPYKLLSEAQYNDQAMKVEGSWALQRRELDGSLKLTTPFEHVGIVQASIKHSLPADNAAQSMRAAVTWGNDGHHVELNINRQLSVSLMPMSESIQLSVSTPIRQLSSLNYKYSYDFRPGYLSYAESLKMNTMPEAYSVNLVYEKNPTNQLSFRLTSPWPEVRNVHVTGRCDTRSGVAAFVSAALNGEQLVEASVVARGTSFRSNTGEIIIESAKWNQYIKAKMENDFDFTDKVMSMLAEVEYARGKAIAMRYNHQQTPDGSVRLTLTTPFPEADFSYVARYSKSKTDTTYHWQEHTEFTSSIVSIVSDTDFAFDNGLAMNHRSTATYKGTSYTTNKSFSFVGNAAQFVLQLTCDSSYMPAVKASASWTASPLLLRATANGYEYELSFNGGARDFACQIRAEFPLKSQKQHISGSLQFSSSSQGIAMNVNMRTPFAELASFKASVDANETVGTSIAELESTSPYYHSVSYDRSTGLRSKGDVRLGSYVPLRWSADASADGSAVTGLAVLTLRSDRVLTSTVNVSGSQGNLSVKDANNVGFTLAFDDSSSQQQQLLLPRVVPYVELSVHRTDGTTDTYSLAKAYALARAA